MDPCVAPLLLSLSSSLLDCAKKSGLLTILFADSEPSQPLRLG